MNSKKAKQLRKEVYGNENPGSSNRTYVPAPKKQGGYFIRTKEGKVIPWGTIMASGKRRIYQVMKKINQMNKISKTI